MAVFTALRNKAGQVAAGLAGSAIKSTLGLNRAPGALGSSADAGPKSRNSANADYMQYPADLSHESNSHFVLFTVKTFEGKNKTDTTTTGTATKNLDKALGDAASNVVKNSTRGRGSLQLTSRAATKSGPYIALYMPPSVQEVYSLRYNDTEISSLANIAHAAYQSFKNTQESGAAFQSLLKPGSEFLAGIQSAANKTAVNIADAISKGGAAAIGIERGVVFTPKMELMFEGVNRRGFSYSFIMMPTSHDEAVEIEKIIRTFKTHAAPNYAKDDRLGMEMTIPDRFHIEYYSTAPGKDGAPKPNGYLTSIGECFLEQVTVVYGGDKYIAHYPDIKGSPPARIQLTLSFRELEIQTREMIEQSISSLPGVTASAAVPAARKLNITDHVPQGADQNLF
jgi:hypothetical protein